MAIKGGQRGGRKEPAHRLNELITDIPGDEVRLIKFDGEPGGIVTLDEAMDQADTAGVDLVEMSPTAKPPVCRVMDYGKFIYEKAKEQKEQRKNQKQIQVKEIKFRPGTDEGDARSCLTGHPAVAWGAWLLGTCDDAAAARHARTRRRAGRRHRLQQCL